MRKWDLGLEICWVGLGLGDGEEREREVEGIWGSFLGIFLGGSVRRESLYMKM